MAPVLPTFTVEPDSKFVPVNVAATVSPSGVEEGETEIKVGGVLPPPGPDVVAATTSSVRASPAVAPVESMTCTLNVVLPAVVGAPLMPPVVLRESPAGRLPEVMDHV